MIIYPHLIITFPLILFCMFGVLKMSRFTRFSRGKIWFFDIGSCKRFDIFQLWGKGKNPRSGAKVKICGAGRSGAKKRVNRLNPKMLHKCVNEKYDIIYHNINHNIGRKPVLYSCHLDNLKYIYLLLLTC